MATIYWLEDTDKKRVCLRFSDGSQSAYRYTKLEAFNLVLVETRNRNIEPEEAMQLLQELKEFDYLENEHIEIHLIDLYLQQAGPLNNPALESCISCNFCSDGKQSFPHRYFTYQEDGKFIRIEYIIRSKDVAYIILDILTNYGLLYAYDEKQLEECIGESNLPDTLPSPFSLN